MNDLPPSSFLLPPSLSVSLGILDAIFLGILQGLTEFLPVSSSAHLALLQYFRGLDLPLFFDVMLHVGTLAAVLIYYGKGLWTDGMDSLEPEVSGTAAAKSAPPAGKSPIPSLVRLGVLLFVATIPVGVAYKSFEPSEKDAAGNLVAPIGWRNHVANLREYRADHPWAILGFLTFTGFMLLAGSRAHSGTVDFGAMKWWQALLIGVAQMFSMLCPGLSRSGMTISAGLLLGLRGDWAVHFGLLMSIPTILAAALVKTLELDPEHLTGQFVVATGLGTLISAAIGYLCITLLLKAVRRGRWWWFSIYVWSLVVVVAAILIATGR